MVLTAVDCLGLILDHHLVCTVRKRVFVLGSILNPMRPDSLKALSRPCRTSPYTSEPDHFPVRKLYIDPEASEIQVRKLYGRSFPVAQNLKSILKHLRRDRERFLWIDALCINESDMDGGHLQLPTASW